MSDPLNDALDEFASQNNDKKSGADEASYAAPTRVSTGSFNLDDSPATPATRSAPLPTAADSQQADPLDGALEEFGARQADDQFKTGLLHWQSVNNTTPPDQQAEILRYSAASGLAPDFVKQNLDDIKRRVNANNVDWEELAKERPALSNYLLTHPEAHGAVNDDIANLSFVEKWITGKWNVVSAEMPLIPGIAGSPTISVPYTLRRELPTATEAAIDDSIAKQKLGYYQAKDVARNLVGDWSIGTFDANMGLPGTPSLPVPYISRKASKGLSVEDQQAVEEIKRANPPRELAKPNQLIARAFLGTVGFAPQAIGTALAATAGNFAFGPPGAVAAGVAFNTYQNLGPTNEAIQSMKGPEGQEVDPDVAHILSLTTSLAGGVVMETGLTPILRPLMKDAAKVAVSKALQSPTLQRAAAQNVLEFGKHWLGGATAMAAQTAMNATAEQLAAKSAYGAKFDTGAVGTQTAEAFEQGLIDLAFLSAAGPARQYLHDVGEIRNSEASTRQLEYLVDAAKQSKSLARSPELFQQAVHEMAQHPEAEVKEIHHPVSDWVEYWQEKKVDPQAVAAEVMGDGGKAYQEALATGGDLSIPVAPYLAKLGNTEHIKGLSEVRKLAPDELTPKQQTQARENLQNKLKEEITARRNELKEGKQAVSDFIYDQATAAGIGKAEAQAVAKIAAETAVTTAVNLKTSVRQAARIGLLDRLRVLGPNGEVAAQHVIDRFQAFLEPEASKPIANIEGAPIFADLTPQNLDVPEDTSFDVQAFDNQAQRNAPEGIAQARDFVGRMRSEERKAMASAWVDFAEGKGERPKEMDAKLERELAEFGVVDPERGYTFDESGRSMERPVTTRKKLNEEPESLKQDRLQRSGADAGYGGKWDQAGLKRKLDRGEVVGHLSKEKLNDDTKVVVATGDELGPEPTRKAAREFLASLRGTTETNVDSGWEIRFYSAGNKKATSGTLPREHLLAIAKVQELVRNGVLATSAGDLSVEPRPDVYAFHAIYAPLVVDGRLLRVKLTVSETKEGDGFYKLDPEADIKIESSASFAEGRSSTEDATPSSSSPPSTIKNSQLLEGALGPDNKPLVSDGLAALPSDALKQEGRAAAAPRGSIAMRLGVGGKPVSLDISVFNGDKSTFAHEFGHFLSWSLHEVAHSDLATPEIRDDYGKLLDFAGYESPEQRLAERGERAQLALKPAEERTSEEKARLNALTVKEEKISHAWEQYLAEGKAPSKALGRVFARFKDWMLFIYKGLDGIGHQFRSQYGQELKLSDDVRGIFDRLLAVDDAIERARQETESPKTGAAEILALMTPDERQQYEGILADSRISSDAEVQKRIDELREQRAGENRKVIEQQVEAELDSDPAHRAMRFLQHGELADSEGVVRSGKELPDVLKGKSGGPLKLNRKSFVDSFGSKAARDMPPGIFSGRTRDGVSTEALAPMLGFESGKDLVAAMSGEHRDDAIARLTQERMDAKYGPALEHIQASAMSALHNEHSLRATLLELRAMAKQVNPATAGRVKSVSIAELRATASRMLDAATVGDLDPNHYARAERRAALDAAELWGKGEKEKAVERREARLLNQILYIEARDRRVELDKATARLERTTTEARAAMGKADPVFRDAHDGILGAVGLGDAPTRDARTAFESMLKLMDNAAQDVGFDADGIRELLTTNKDWESLPLADAFNVVDAITNIRHAASEKNEITLAGKRQTKDAWFEELKQHIALRGSRPLAPFDPAARTFKDSVRSTTGGADALLADMETLAHMLDAGDAKGPVRRLLIDARLESRGKSHELARRVLNTINEKWENVPAEIRKLQGERVDVDLPLPKAYEGRYSNVFTRSSIWMLFLNSGNEGNRQRIRDGFGWSDDQVSKAISILSKPELTYLQGVLDSIQSLYPDLAEAHERRTGLQLGKVEATPIQVNGESYAGGYFPLKYDARASKAGEVQEGDVVKSLFAPNYQKPVTPSGHRQARVQKVDQPVSLEWGVVPAHIAQVIHDISYGDWVREAGGIVMDPRFRVLAEQALGPERAKEFAPWLRDVANARADSAAGTNSGLLKKMGSVARNRATAVALAWNLPNYLQGMTDPWLAKLEGVNTSRVATAYLKIMNPANWNALQELKDSKELAYKADNFHNNLRQLFDEAGGTKKTGINHALVETGLKVYEILDGFSSRVTFKAAYDQAKAEGMTHEESVKRADDVIRRRYGSGDLAEKAAALRSKNGLAALLVFQSYANRNYNGLRRSFDDYYVSTAGPDVSVKDRASAVNELAAKLIVFGVVGAAGSYLAGRGPTDDESKGEWILKKALLEPFNTVPFIGPMAEWGLMRLTGEKGQKFSVRSAPELSLVEDSLNRLGELGRKIQKGDLSKTDEAMLLADTLMTLGGVGGAAQIHRTTNYVEKVRNGEVRPRGILDALSGAVYGHRKMQGSNPLADTQDVISGQR